MTEWVMGDQLIWEGAAENGLASDVTLMEVKPEGGFYWVMDCEGKQYKVIGDKLSLAPIGERENERISP